MTIKIEAPSLQKNDAGYVQAVANAAYLLVHHADELVNNFFETSDPSRLVEFFKSVDDDVSNAETQFVEYLSFEIIPVIAETYGVNEELVAEDVSAMTDYYSCVTLANLFGNI